MSQGGGVWGNRGGSRGGGNTRGRGGPGGAGGDSGGVWGRGSGPTPTPLGNVQGPPDQGCFAPPPGPGPALNVNAPAWGPPGRSLATGGGGGGGGGAWGARPPQPSGGGGQLPQGAAGGIAGSNFTGDLRRSLNDPGPTLQSPQDGNGNAPGPHGPAPAVAPAPAAPRGGGSSRGRGGGGRGGAEGGERGARRGRRDEDFDMVLSRGVDATGQIKAKKAVLGTSKEIKLEGNFFKVECKPDWCIYHYRVDFLPDEEDTRMKKRLLRVHARSFGAYVFDGSSLYVCSRLAPDPMILCSMRETDQAKIELHIRLVAQLAHTDIMYLQLLNIIVRTSMEQLGLEEMGRHYFDSNKAIKIEAHRLELWPGYKTSMRNYEDGLMFNVEITHKVLRLDSCLQVMNQMSGRSRDDPKVKIRDELVGTIVMTKYNRKTYRVDDIDWDTTPLSTFDMRGRQVSFMDYFKEKYGLTIRDPRQPMLVSRPKKRDYHRGMTGPILLIPELCQMTGITDEMRANNQLMRTMAEHLHVDPVRRVEKLKEFMQRLGGVPAVQENLQKWGLTFNRRLVDFKGHVIPNETILFGGVHKEAPDHKYDWGAAFRNKPLLSVVPLQKWAIMAPSRDAPGIQKLVTTMKRVSRPMSFAIAEPLVVRSMRDIRPNDYSRTVEELMHEHQGQLQMIFAILPRQEIHTYSAVKKRCCVEFGVPSQCFVSRNLHDEKRLMSICTKLVVQMAAKLGGEPWTVHVPLTNMMVVGFDVYHCGKRSGNSVGAMVATTSGSYAKYFSTTSQHATRNDLSENVSVDFRKCLLAYMKVNNMLPDRIIMYRDGVGDGQLQYVYETELKNIKVALDEVYRPRGREPPKLTFIVVTKRINARIFAMERGRHSNPSPGTVADDAITFPERYDFYLIAQHSRLGTVSPVAYNVLEDNSGLDPDKMQKLTFKMCHLYFNWSGTVTVPAPCQYAHKLAYLTGTALGGRSHEKLSNLLYFL